MGYRDLRASFAQFNLAPIDPEVERQERIESIIDESIREYGVDVAEFSSPFTDGSEEWTVVYDKFQVHRR